MIVSIKGLLICHATLEALVPVNFETHDDGKIMKAVKIYAQDVYGDDDTTQVYNKS